MQLGRRVGVGKGAGIVEDEFDATLLNDPGFDLAHAGLQVVRERVAQAGTHQAEHRLRVAPASF